jgi:hypothetical protein
LFELGINGSDLGLEILQMLKIDRQSGLEMALERLPKLTKPEEVLLGPCGLCTVEDVTVITQGTGDTMLRGSDLCMVASSEPEEST